MMSEDVEREMGILMERIRYFFSIAPSAPTLNTTGEFWRALYAARASLKILDAIREEENERAKQHQARS